MPTRGDPDRLLSRLLRGLARHLALALILKALVLTGLWHAFIKPYRVEVDRNAMGERIAGSSNQQNRENQYDRLNGR